MMTIYSINKRILIIVEGMGFVGIHVIIRNMLLFGFIYVEKEMKYEKKTNRVIFERERERELASFALHAA